MSSDDYAFLDKGYTSNVYRLPGTRKVCKSFLPRCTETNFPAEREAYERFTAREGQPSSILRYYGVDKVQPAGIILDLAENGNLHSYLWDRKRHNKPPSQEQLYRWARQAAEGLQFAHSCGVFHSDIHCVNFLLDENFDLKVADFAGASIDGGKSWSFYRRTHRLFGPEGEETGGDGMKITVASEIFGFGSALYNMVAGRDVFSPELDYEDHREEIIKRIQEKRFPDTSELPILGPVISKCWNQEYVSMDDVIEGIDGESH
jgi:serine/threonine protein kinase